MIIYFNNGLNPFVTYFEKCGHKLITPYNRKLKVRFIRKLEKWNYLRGFLYNIGEIRPQVGEKIIIFDSNISSSFLMWIRNNFTQNRIIFWYWNPVKTSINPANIPNGIEKWSYSPKDCKSYNLRYNTTFYFDSIIPINSRQNMKNKKALFVGRDKGRLKELLNLKRKLEYEKIVCNFYIIGDIHSKDYSYEKTLDYSEVIRLILEADILIDYYTDENAGLSLRPMEAMFFGKKMITNNKTISNYDFYCQDNIFGFDSDDSELKVFLTKPYKEIPKNIKETYLFTRWLERFGD